MPNILVGWGPWVWAPEVWEDFVWETEPLAEIVETCPLPPALLAIPYEHEIELDRPLNADAVLEVSAGALPTGLALEGNVITGTPTEDGLWAFTLRVRWGPVVSEPFSCQLEVRDTTPAASGCARDFMVLGSRVGASSGLIYLPDALDSFTSDLSVEQGTVFALRSKAYAPLGTDGRVVWRRLYISGYARGEAGLWATPIVDGRPLLDLRTWFHAPAPQAGQIERFHFLLALGHGGDFAHGILGAALAVQIETTDPPDVWHLETVGLAHEPIGTARGRYAGEMEPE